jgi:hypothetical protein
MSFDQTTFSLLDRNVMKAGVGHVLERQTSNDTCPPRGTIVLLPIKEIVIGSDEGVDVADGVIPDVGDAVGVGVDVVVAVTVGSTVGECVADEVRVGSGVAEAV